MYPGMTARLINMDGQSDVLRRALTSGVADSSLLGDGYGPGRGWLVEVWRCRDDEVMIVVNTANYKYHSSNG